MATRNIDDVINFNDASKNSEIAVVDRFELSWLLGFKSLKKKMLHEFELIKV